MMVVTSPKLSALVLLAIPVIVLPLVASGRAVRRRSRAAQDRLADASALPRRPSARCAPCRPSARRGHRRPFTAAAEEAFDAARRSTTRARSSSRRVAIFLVFASVVGVLWYGAQDVLAGEMTGGRLSQFVLYAVFAAGALGELSQVWGEVSAAAGAAERIAEILAVEPRDRRRPRNPTPLPEPPLGTVAFQDVHFAYPTRAGQRALRWR